MAQMVKQTLAHDGKPVFDIVVRSKETGKIIKTQCSDYARLGNLRRFLALHEDKIEVIIAEPAPGYFIGWNFFKSML